jgi:hypothetical protein
MTVDEMGEIGQFLATLLVLQGTGDVDESDKAVLIPKLKQWKTIYSGRLASDTSERCLALLTDDSFVALLNYTSIQLMSTSQRHKANDAIC